jgi:hypothetical protein
MAQFNPDANDSQPSDPSSNQILGRSILSSDFKELPSFLKAKRAVVNVQNEDNRSFGYAILTGLYYEKVNRYFDSEIRVLSQLFISFPL